MIQRASRMAMVKPNAIGELLRQGADPGLISFAGGYPDPSLFPATELQQTYSEVILQQGGGSLQYTVSDGPLAFREQIAERVRAKGMACGSSNILILQGSQQGLDLVGKMLLDPGDVVVTENPTFLGATVAFNPNQPIYAPVRMDQDGMDVDHLEHVLKSSPRVKLIYTIPDFQNPTGVTLSLERRKRLIALANQFDVMVLEDTAYRELRYEGQSPPTLKSFDTEDRVIMLGSFSKILVPGLRLGWAVASESVIRDLGLLKLAADTQCSTINMAATSLFLERFNIDQHVEKLRGAYLRKKNLMLDALRQNFPQDVSFTDPQGGLFTWLTFPADFDAARFLQEKALPVAKVAYVPGGTFFPVSEEMNHARFNFSGQTDENIVRGISSLGRLLKKELAQS